MKVNVVGSPNTGPSGKWLVLIGLIFAGLGAVGALLAPLVLMIISAVGFVLIVWGIVVIIGDYVKGN